MRAIWAGALLVVYLAATGLLLLLGHSRVATVGLALHFAVLGAIAVATWHPIVPRWLRAWAPLFALLFLYTEMPMLIRAAGHVRFFDAEVVQWEHAIFGAQPALAWAAHWRSRIGSELLHGAYLSYYGIIFSVPVGLYFAGRYADFAEAVFVLMLTFVSCFVLYVVFPVAGPRYLWSSPASADAGPLRAAAVWLLEARSSRGTAFPSSHVAVSVTQSILAVRYFGRRGAIIGVLGLGLALGAVYGGFHYAIDVIAGAMLGGAVTLSGLRLAKRLATSGSQAKAIAPT
jgi:membrane-associated phospholipid phosphatase